jgi:hypothetical protein
MLHRHFVFVTGLVLVMSLSERQVAAQAPAATTNPSTTNKAWKVPRTPDGQPDLQGVWANNNATPLERPTVLAGRATLTDEEVTALKKKAGQLFNGDGDAAFGDEIFRSVLESVKAGQSTPYRKAADEFDFGTGDYNSFWLVQRDWDNRTSLITDPPDGRLPPMTPQGQKRRDAANAARQRPAQGPEDRSLGERCVTFGTPSLRAGYNSYYQIVQTPGYVVILMEMAHDARIIPLDRRPHVPSMVHQWMGDSRGHWEGDTLVVDTTNYAPQGFQATSSAKLHVVERFTRTGPEIIKYEFTIDDPDTWTKPWSVMIPLRHSPDKLFEYACHEGNTGLEGILTGARADEERASK